jgi:hypothetical protein
MTYVPLLVAAAADARPEIAIWRPFGDHTGGPKPGTPIALQFPGDGGVTSFPVGVVSLTPQLVE